MKLKNDWGELLSLILIGFIFGILFTLWIVKKDVNSGNQFIIEKLKVKGDNNEVVISPTQDQNKTKWWKRK